MHQQKKAAWNEMTWWLVLPSSRVKLAEPSRVCWIMTARSARRARVVTRSTCEFVVKPSSVSHLPQSLWKCQGLKRSLALPSLPAVLWEHNLSLIYIMNIIGWMCSRVVHSTGNPWVTQAVPAPTPVLNPYPCSWVWVPAGMTHGYVKFSCCSLIGEWWYFCTKISHLLLKIYMKIYPQIMNWWMVGFLHKKSYICYWNYYEIYPQIMNWWMAGFLHKKFYINIGLMYNVTTRLTRGTGTGLGRVPQTRPVPVPTQPIPGYPRGFTNPCYALFTCTFTVKLASWASCNSSKLAWSSLIELTNSTRLARLDGNTNDGDCHFKRSLIFLLY